MDLVSALSPVSKQDDLDTIGLAWLKIDAHQKVWDGSAHEEAMKLAFHMATSPLGHVLSNSV